MNLTPLEATVKDVCLALLAVGVRPAGRDLAARVPGRNQDDLIRIRNRLAAQGELPAAAWRGSTLPRSRRAPTPIPEAERQEVIAACRELIADGLYPSVDRLRGRFPGRDGQRLRQIRDEAAAAGLIKLGTPGEHGLLGRTAKERTEVKERTEKIRQQKIARGEVPRPVVMRILRDRQFDRWFVGRRP